MAKTITPNQDFKHGRETYKKGKPYQVSEGEAYYFQQCGWLSDSPAKKSGKKSTTLEIHDTEHGHEAEVK